MLEELTKLSQHFLQIKNQEYQRYFIQTNPFTERLSILLGQRGVGKTTTLIQYLLLQAKGDYFSSHILYVQADHFLVANNSLYEIAEQFSLHGGKVIAFDEIHKYPNWSLELKSIVDTFPRLKILASGSSALEIHKGTHDLSRRALMYKMYGLSFREYLGLYCNVDLPCYTLLEILKDHQRLADQCIKKLNGSGKTLLEHFENYLHYGYYPYFKEVNDAAAYDILLEQNLHISIESDLAAIYPQLTGNSIRKIKQLLAYIAQVVPFTPNWEKIKSIVDVGDIRTLKTYFKYLEDAGLIHVISSASSKMHALESPEKIYLNNTNQIYALSGDLSNKGTIREAFFLNSLATRHKVALPSQGDFLIDHHYLFEIGGRKKDHRQIVNHKNGYIASDDIEIGVGDKIPLWLFGFLY
jgi:hypothetical protein